MSELVTLSKDGDVAILTINNPPVNALSPGVPEGIAAGMESVRNDPAIKAVILIGGGRTFIAGADIKEFVKITAGTKPLDLGVDRMLNVVENFPKPVICAIHGTALGGGLETAMGCHYRVAAVKSQVGQPEVKLGLIPGAGGTQRLPRLVGVAKAAEICAGGDMIPATEAKKLGIIDELIEGELLPGAISYARKLLAEGKGPRRTPDLTDKISDAAANAAAIAMVKEVVKKKARGLIAPVKAVEAVEISTQVPFEEGLKKEVEIFKECIFSDQSKALVHAFLAEREVGKIPGLGKDVPIKPIKKAAVVGAGTMGGGIAMNYANAGIPVLLKETDQAALDKGLERIKGNYAATVQKGRLTQEQMDKRMACIEPTLTYDKFQEADIVVEAVFEGMELKKKIFGELDKVTRPDAILASNTSTLNIDEIASATTRPQQVIGHHFFSPANVMKLLEVVRGKASSPEVIATSMAVSRTLAKVGVLVGNCRGFVGNRMFDPYTREAQFLVEEGAKVEEVDKVLTDFGWAMGPMAVVDLAGIDVCWRIRREYEHLKPAGERDVLIVDKLYEKGRYGQKTGAGWYKYEGRNAVPDAEVEALIETETAKAGIKRRKITPEEIIERTVYMLVNEGAKILEEGYALRAMDIDIVYLYGYGFPAYRGGPMWYADTVGLKKVYERIREFEKEHGAIWTPAPLLKKLAESGKTFADFDQEKSGG
ncbi:MAG: 3-hydroxyacyl-CoA dehydrogenase NAD-binding domain-containing protein [Planctomycetales bacterium]